MKIPDSIYKKAEEATRHPEDGSWTKNPLEAYLACYQDLISGGPDGWIESQEFVSEKAWGKFKRIWSRKMSDCIPTKLLRMEGVGEMKLEEIARALVSEVEIVFDMVRPRDGIDRSEQRSAFIAETSIKEGLRIALKLTDKNQEYKSGTELEKILDTGEVPNE